VHLLGLNRFLTANGLNLGALLGFALVMGFGGAIISLLMSKPMAKWSTGAQVINDSPDPTHRWIVGTVSALPRRPASRCPRSPSTKASPMPSPPARSRTRRWWRCPPACCIGMSREEVEAVIGHEVAHVANGDMVTMTLIQGVMNTFVVFLSRVIGYFVDKVVLRNTATARASATTSPPSCSTSCWAWWPPSSWPGSRASANTAPTPAPPP
jgi:heat shock protein HtpX